MTFEIKYETILGEGIKILTPKQTFQKLAIAHAQVKSDNASEKLLNEIHQITCSLCITQKRLLKKNLII